MEVDMLKEMFPQFDGAVVEAVYDSVGRDIETASTLLLAPSFDPSFYSQMPEPVVSYPKEPERRKKRPFEAYWTNTSIDSFKANLVKMWEEERGVDVALNCTDGVSIWAHKLVLRARCPYLSVLLMSDAVFDRGNVEELHLGSQNESSFSSSLPATIPSSSPSSTHPSSEQANPSDAASAEQSHEAPAEDDWKDKCLKIDVDMNSLVARVIVRWMYTDEFDLDRLFSSDKKSNDDGKKKNEKPKSSFLQQQRQLRQQMVDQHLHRPYRNESSEESSSSSSGSEDDGFPIIDPFFSKKAAGRGRRGGAEEKASLDEGAMDLTMQIHQAASDLDLHAIRLICEFSDHLPSSTFATDFLSLLYGDSSHEWSDLVIEAGGEDEGEEDYDQVKAEDGTWEAVEEEEKLSGAEDSMALPMSMYASEIKSNGLNEEAEGSRVVFYAHKLILSCCSEYFEEMFGGRWAEKKASRLFLTDIGPLTLQRMLENMYTNGRVRKGRGLTLTKPSSSSQSQVLIHHHQQQEDELPLYSGGAGYDSHHDPHSYHSFQQPSLDQSPSHDGRTLVKSRPCGLNENNALPTFIVANKYGVRSLEHKAEEEMEQWVDDSNVYPLLSQPSISLSPSSRLYRFCIEYAARRYDPETTEKSPDWSLIAPKDQTEIQSAASSLPLRFALSLLAHNMSAHERRKIAGDDTDLEELKDTLANARAERVSTDFYLNIFRSCLKDVFVSNFETIHNIPADETSFTFKATTSWINQNGAGSSASSASSSALSSPPSNAVQQKSTRKCPFIEPSEEIRALYTFPLLDCPSLAWGSRAHFLSRPDPAKALAYAMACGQAVKRDAPKKQRTNLFGSKSASYNSRPLRREVSDSDEEGNEETTIAAEVGTLFSKVSNLVSDLGAARRAAAASSSSSLSGSHLPASSLAEGVLRVTYTPSSFYPPPAAPSKAPKPGRLGRLPTLFDNGVSTFTKPRSGRTSPWIRASALPTAWELDTYRNDHPIVAPKKKLLTGKWDESALADTVETLILAAYTTLSPDATNTNFFGHGNPGSDDDDDDEDMSDLDRAMAALTRGNAAAADEDGSDDGSYSSEEEDIDDFDGDTSGSDSDSSSSSNSDDEEDVMFKKFGNAQAKLEMRDANSLLFTLSNVSFRLPHTDFAIDMRAPNGSTDSFEGEPLRRRYRAKAEREAENDFFRLPWDVRAKIMAEARSKGFEGRIEEDESPVEDAGIMDLLVSGVSISILFSFNSHPASQLSSVLSSIISDTVRNRDTEEDEDAKTLKKAIKKSKRAFSEQKEAEARAFFPQFARGREDDSDDDDDDDDTDSDSSSDSEIKNILAAGSLDDIKKMLDHLGISELGDQADRYGLGTRSFGSRREAALPFIFANDLGAAATRVTAFKAEVIECSIGRVDMRVPESSRHGLANLAAIPPSPAHPFSFWPYYAADLLPAFHVSIEAGIRKHLGLPVSFLAKHLSLLSVKHHCRAAEMLAAQRH